MNYEAEQANYVIDLEKGEIASINGKGVRVGVGSNEPVIIKKTLGERHCAPIALRHDSVYWSVFALVNGEEVLICQFMDTGVPLTRPSIWTRLKHWWSTKR